MVPRRLGLMSRTVLRGRVLSFHRAPETVEDSESYLYLEDGAVLIEDGVIVTVGDFSAAETAGAVIVDHRPNLIMAGFIDMHLHYVQSQMMASYSGSLL